MAPVAGADGHAADRLNPDDLTPDPEFFELVRRLQDAARRGGGVAGAALIGGDAAAADEPVRLRAAAGQARPAAEVAGTRQRLTDGPEAPPRTEVEVGFLGLTGPLGVLPEHYTERVVEGRRNREEALGDFLALFDHRLLSLFWRAWARNRAAVAVEWDRANLSDPFARALAGLAGLGAGGEAVPDEGLIGMAGAMARPVRSADALRRLLHALFGLPVEVLELEGRWRALGENDRTRLGSDAADGAWCALGRDAVAGAAVFDVANGFAVRVGPLDADAFNSFFADDGPRGPMIDAVRRAVGGGADFEIRLVLRAADVPALRLTAGTAAPRLSQTSWLLHAPATRDRDEARLRPVQPGGGFGA